MSETTSRVTARQPPQAVLQQAAVWYARLRDGTAGVRLQTEWKRWLEAAEEHQRAWRYVQDISRGFEPLRSTVGPQQTVNALHAAEERLRSRRRVFASFAALAGSGLLGTLAWQSGSLSGEIVAWRADHRTGIGEQRSVTLSDGTLVWLNTASAIDIKFNTIERRIRLITGEIFVDTAKDPARPLLVDTTMGRLHALGTRFNVYQGGDEIRLTVHDGAVEVRTATSGDIRVAQRGEQIRFTTDRISSPDTAPPTREGWMRNTLTVENTSLRDVIRELGRYRKGYLGVAEEIADLRVFGSFPVRDTDRVLHMLAAALPIRIEQPLPWWTSVEPYRQ